MKPLKIHVTETMEGNVFLEKKSNTDDPDFVKYKCLYTLT